MSATVETKTEPPSTYHAFYEAFDGIKSNVNTNDINTSIMCNFINILGIKSNDLIMLSLVLRSPIAQFIVDVYFQYVVKCNSNINDFMAKSNFLSMFSHDSKPWQATRRHLGQYLKEIYLPVHNNGKSDIKIHYKHNMPGILFYTSVIHENIYILNKACQIDVIFVPKFLDFINDEYFRALGIKHEKFNCETGIKQMLRRLNDQLDDKQFNRCIILIMENNDISTDTVYAFEPTENNSLPAEIYNRTEIPWISNTKSNILPELSSNDHDALCLSFHKHSYHNNVVIERVYLSCGGYGSRVFKHNFEDVLAPFCVSKDEHPRIDWDEEVNNREFKDYEYNFFLNTFFADLQLVNPNIYGYFNDCKYIDNAWMKFLYKCVNTDKELSLHYMYIPLPIEYYQYIDVKISEYYKCMNKMYNHQFIKFIYDNELEDCELSDNLGTDVEVTDCILLDFDEFFPLSNNNNNLQRDEFLFNFLQNLFL